jgi:hypothetical protein
MRNIDIFGTETAIKVKKINKQAEGKSQLKILSLGLGVQSTALYFMSSLGIIERADYAIFADPGKESKKTYEYLKFLKKWQIENNGIPIIIRSKSNIYNDLLSGFNTSGNRCKSIPAFTVDGSGKVGIIRRQCTSEYKIDVVNKTIRFDIYKKPARVRLPLTEMMIGISLDEFERMSIAPERWRRNIYPLVDLRMTRQDCKNWLKKNDLPEPPKSACIFCPFTGDARWLEMKENEPEEFEEACFFDDHIRNGSKRGFKQPIFIHRSCKPLREVTFDNQGNEELFNIECKGVCGV